MGDTQRGLKIALFALIGRSQHRFVELLVGREEHVLARVLLVIILLVWRELPHQLSARGALDDHERLMLQAGTLEQLSRESLGVNDDGSECTRHAAGIVGRFGVHPKPAARRQTCGPSVF